VLSYRLMAEGNPLRLAYLICGSDRPKVRRAVERLRRRVVAESGSDLNVTVFDVGEAEERQTAQAKRAEVLAAMLATLDTPSFIPGLRLVLVTNGHRWLAKDRQALVRYLEDPMPDAVLAVEGDTFGKDDALFKAVAKRGEVLRYDLPKRHELPGWVRERARSRHLPLDAAAARHLLAVVGEDPDRLERELDKLAAYCRGQEATADAIDAVCSASIETKVFDLMDAVGHRDRAEAFRRLEEVYAAGEEPQRVFFSLVRHVRLLERTMELAKTREPKPADLAKQLGVHPFTARKLAEQHRSYDWRTIDRALAGLAEADAAMRGEAAVTFESSGGVNHTDRFALELALARMLG
jgi:DNA polymerase III subunit delta